MLIYPTIKMSPLLGVQGLGGGLGYLAGSGPPLPTVIGEFGQGGYFAGYISHTADGNATHGLIVAPAASGYNGEASLQFKTSNTSSSGTSSSYDGATNSANINNSSHPAAQYCEGLSINGFTDWYLPARYELEIAYFNLRPGTDSNSTSWGTNDYSVPKRTVNYTSSNPPRTSLTDFRTGGSEEFQADNHWSSTTTTSAGAWIVIFGGGLQSNPDKNISHLVRAFRKFAV